MVLDQQPFNVVEAPAFQQLIWMASPNCCGQADGIPSRYLVTERVEEMNEKAVKTIKEKLIGTRPAVTDDIWTANDGVSFNFRTVVGLRVNSRKHGPV